MRKKLSKIFHIIFPFRKIDSRMTTLKMLILPVLILLSAGCKKTVEETGTVGICPEVLSTSPANAATGVNLNSSVTATFNEALDPASVTATTFIVTKGSVPVAGVLSYSGVTATFTPTGDLSPNTVYTGRLTTGIKDPAKNAMIADFVWSFTTGAGPDIIPPTVTSTDPANASIGVALNKKISVAFSETMDSLSVTKSFTLANTTAGGSNVIGSVSYTGLTAVFLPTDDLLPNTTYAGTISTVAKDLAGNALVANYVFNFTTGAAPDITRPVVTATIPTNTATNVPLNTKLSATFSEAMDPATISNSSFRLNQGSTAIPCTVTYTGMIATFAPSSNLTPNTVYTATITQAATDLAGNAMLVDYVWSFTTGAAPDVVRPTVISTDPVNNATAVSFDKKITATFSEVMDPLSINTQTFTLRNGNTAVLGTVTYNGLVATFSPLANLAAATVYTASISTSARDLAGNTIASAYSWSFTTAAAPDVLRPTIISTDPTNNATGVTLNKVITVTFSEPMNPTSINASSFLVRVGAVTIPGTITYSGVVATFTPTSPLQASTNYVANITTAVRDVAGNTLAANYLWNFTTLTPPPSLGSAASFGAFGGSAGVTNQGLNTVINNGGLGTTGASTLVTGFHDGLTGDVYTETPLNKGNVTGGIFTAPPAPGTSTSFNKATLAQSDATTAFNSISPASKPGGIDPGAGELGGLTLAPGIYKSASGTFKISNGNLVLDAKGDPNAVWIFQTDAGLTVGIAGPAGARSVTMINGGQAKNVFWYVGSSATINGAGGGIMSGNIIAAQGVTFSTAGNAVQTVLNGRALSLNASVTMVNTTINVQ